MQQLVDALLEGAILGTETVRLDFPGKRRHTGQQIVRLYPPREPGVQLGLAAEFIHQIAVVIENRTVANHVRRVPPQSARAESRAGPRAWSPYSRETENGERPP